MSNSNMAFGYRLTPDLATEILATAAGSHRPPVPRLVRVPRTDPLPPGPRPKVAEDN